MYATPQELHRLSTLNRTLPLHDSDRLAPWISGGQYGYIFDNPEDALQMQSLQCFNFEGFEKSPEILEPLLFYILHLASRVIYDPAQAERFKVFIIDEAWMFFTNPTIKKYIIEALKTWRKKNACMILAISVDGRDAQVGDP